MKAGIGLEHLLAAVLSQPLVGLGQDRLAIEVVDLLEQVGDQELVRSAGDSRTPRRS